MKNTHSWFHEVSAIGEISTNSKNLSRKRGRMNPRQIKQFDGLNLTFHLLMISAREQNQKGTTSNTLLRQIMASRA